MKTAARLLFPVLTLLIGAASARGQATTTAYSNLKNTISAIQLGGATATGGSTDLLADDLTYNASLAGQAISAFQVQLINYNSTTVSVTPTVIFWNSNGPIGTPGAVLGSYVLPLTALAGSTEQTLSFTVPVKNQFVLPVSGTIWAGIFVTGTSTATAAQLNNIAVPIVNPPTTGSSQDRLFESISPGPAAAANPSGAVFTSPYGGNPVANLGWALTTITPGTLHVVDNFPASAFSFAGPEGALLLAADGNYYGTTVEEGAAGDGTIFQLTPAGTINTIFEFSGVNGTNPRGALIQGNDGLLYGTTSTGGVNGNGTIFSIPTGSTTQALKVLHSFAPGGPGDPNADGTLPSNALIQARDGNFYGVAGGGGAAGDGTVFRITPAGAFTLLASFGSDATAPSNPAGALIEDADGNLVGITQLGGANGHGAIFQLTLAGTLTTLDSLAAANQRPFGQLVLGADGNFYGVSLFGDADGDGTVFLVTPGINGALTTLASFGIDIPQTGAASHLLMASDGNFYGVADDPGLSIYGVTPGVGGMLDFEQILDGSVGSSPTALIQGSDGNLYGATTGGGTGSNGTIYRLTTALPPVVQFNQSEYAVNEFAGTATIRVDRLGGTDALSVSYTESDGSSLPDTTAVNGTDYTFTQNTLTWAAGDQTPKFFTVPILDRNLTDGSLHSLTLALLQPNGSNKLGTRSTASLTINDTETRIPAITSGLAADGVVGNSFFYTVTANHHPTSFQVMGLPGGLTFNATTAVISGTPTQSGTFGISLIAGNANGSGSATLSLRIILPAPPAFTSAGTANGQQGVAFSFTATARNNPTFSASGLPAGLSINATTGVISGTPTVNGTFNATLTAQNPGGTANAGLVVTILPPPPVFTSAGNASGQQGVAFSFTATATNNPTFAATGLPAGLSINANSGVISGTPTVVGSFSVTLAATSATGTGTATLAITIAGSAPVITSGLTASAQAGQPFTYQITASNGPTGFAATGLPAGLSVDANGLITGTPTVSRSFSVTLAATNATGTGVATLALTVTPAPVVAPMITSAGTASGQAGIAFTYQITAINGPASFAATGLPTGLSVDPTQGTISGTPTVSGTFSVALSALNTGGTGTATLTLSIAPAAVTVPVITSAATASGEVGAAFSYQVTASNGPTGFEASGLPARLSIDPSTGLISGTLTTAAGSYTATLFASNAGGTGTATLTLIVASAPVVPMVSVAVSGDGRAQFGVENGGFVFLRTGDTSTALTVFYKLKGPAKAGVDFKMVSGQLVIPAGAVKAKLKLKPLLNEANPGKLKAKLVVLPVTDGSYVPASTTPVQIAVLRGE